jgi:c-di-GMP-binding flagellar brake protein YcgR
MTYRRSIPLRIEYLPENAKTGLTLSSPREIQAVLRDLQQQKERSVLYYGPRDDFILTRVLDVSDRQVWLDVGPRLNENRDILESGKVVFISSHKQVKVQFASEKIDAVLFEGSAAFILPLPKTLLRLQRREYYRLTTPAVNPLKCHIPRDAVTEGEHDMASILDISAGGVGLVCEERNIVVQPGKIYPGCQIELPDMGTLIATIEVRNSFDITQPGGAVSRRAGCRFDDMTSDMANLLQRYILQMQTRKSR